MQLLPLSLWLLTLTGSTFSDGNVPEIIRVKEGDGVTLPCYINKNIESERFEWKKDRKKDVYLHEGTQLPGQDKEFRGRVSHFDDELKNGDASITISDTKVSDSGVYTCDFPKFNQTFTVRLLVGPKIIKVTEGDKVTLPCNIRNKNIESEPFEWKKDGKVYQHKVGQLSDQDDRVSQLNNGDASITISDTKVSDSGFYTCNFPNLHQTFRVYLIVDPVTKRVKEGDNVTLPCYIKNKDIESERFVWKKDGKKVVYLYEGGQLSGQDDQFRDRVSHFGDDKLKNGEASITISNTTMDDSGVYTCNFPNLHQTFSVRLVVGNCSKTLYEIVSERNPLV